MNLFKSVIEFWVETWKTNRLLFWVEALSTLQGMIACTLLNFTADDPNMLVILTLYVTSAVGLAWCSYIRRASFVMVLMSFYAITSVFGLVKLVLT